MFSKKVNAAPPIPLADFISATLTQIVEGVRMSQQAVQDCGAHINPIGLYLNQSSVTQRTFSGDANVSQDVNFDISITAMEEGSASGRAVLIGVVGFGLGAKLKYETSAVNRITFTIPILLPGSRVGTES